MALHPRTHTYTIQIMTIPRGECSGIFSGLTVPYWAAMSSLTSLIAN
jgi:hypothetical protein